MKRKNFWWCLGFFFLLLLAGGLFYYGYRLEPYRLTVSKVNLQIRGLFRVEGKLKLVHLSDLHIDRPGKREEELVRIVNKLEPDLIVITGDFTQSWADSREAVRVVSRMKAPLGIWGVLGNVDYGNKIRSVADQEAMMKKEKITILHNESRLLKWKNLQFYLTGFTPEVTFEDIKKTQETLAPGIPEIVLIHWPYLLTRIVRFHPALILTGHTHGGQLRLPVVGRYFSRIISRTHYDHGLFQVLNSRVYVSRGIGMSILPLRIFCPPEIVELNVEFSPIPLPDKFP